MLFTNTIDLNKNSLINAVLHPVATDPSTPVDGQIWYRTDTDRYMVRQNGVTKTLAILDDITAGAIAGTLWDAQSVVIAVADNTPVALTFGASTMLGRGATGDLTALTAAQIRTLLNVADGANNGYIAGGTDVAIADGGTGASTAAAARTNLGLVIGTDVQGYSAVLAGTTASFTTALASEIAANTLKVTNATHTGDVTGATALTIAANIVSNAKLADMGNATIKGRATAGSGDPEDLTAAQVRTLLNVADGANVGYTAGGTDVPIADGGTGASTAAAARTNLGLAIGTDVQAYSAALAGTTASFTTAIAAEVTANTAKVTNATHTGDVTGATALTIANDVVTNAKLANVATATIKGRVTAATGDPEDLTAAQVRTLLGVEAGATADMTAAEILAALITVDGAASALDADLLDGQHGTYYATAASVVGLASTSYVDTSISNLIDTAPGTLNTLNELAAALGDDPNFATTVTTSLSGKAGRYATSVGNGTLTSYTVTHSLGTKDVVVSVRQVIDDVAVMADWTATSTSAITVNFATAPTTNQYRVVVIG